MPYGNEKKNCNLNPNAVIYRDYPLIKKKPNNSDTNLQWAIKVSRHRSISLNSKITPKCSQKSVGRIFSSGNWANGALCRQFMRLKRDRLVGKLICWLAKVGSNRMAPAGQTLLSHEAEYSRLGGSGNKFRRDETEVQTKWKPAVGSGLSNKYFPT